MLLCSRDGLDGHKGLRLGYMVEAALSAAALPGVQVTEQVSERMASVREHTGVPDSHSATSGAPLRIHSCHA